MIHDDLDEYFTDPCKRNCFVEIWVDSTLSLMIIHWDLRYNAYQHPCDLTVKLVNLVQVLPGTPHLRGHIKRISVSVDLPPILRPLKNNLILARSKLVLNIKS